MRSLRPSHGRRLGPWTHRAAYAYYTCATRNRHGRTVCDQGRLPKEALEDAILGQMGEVYRDTALVAAAIEEAQTELRAGEAEQKTMRTARQAEAADVRRRIERYLAAFEAGELDPKQVRERVGALQARLDELESELVAPARPVPRPSQSTPRRSRGS